MMEVTLMSTPRPSPELSFSAETCLPSREPSPAWCGLKAVGLLSKGDRAL